MKQRCEECGGRFDRPGLFGCNDGHVTPDLSQSIVAKIEHDLRDRRCLRQAFESIDDDQQDIIRDTWARIVRRGIAKGTP